MTHISASPGSSALALPVQPAVTATTPGERAFNFSVATAVRQLNDTGQAGAGREVTFSIDGATRQPVVKVIDTETKEVIGQFPPKYVLALAAVNESQTKDS
jgi:uncharacterized FlaG/YvyC family protein